MSDASWPHVEYNPISGFYLLAGARLYENPPSSGFYRVVINTKSVRLENGNWAIYTSDIVEDTPIGGNEFSQNKYALVMLRYNRVKLQKADFFLLCKPILE